MKIAILGANGFIGHYLALNLSTTDHNLILFSKKFDDELEKLGNRPNISIVKGDYNDTNIVKKVIKDCELVYHLISASIPITSWENPVVEIEDNVVPSIKLFNICAKTGVKKIVFISSAGTVYGDSTTIADETSITKPFSPYGISKITIELYLEYFRKKNGLNYDIYRLSNPYGPGLNKKGFGVINTWLRNIKLDKPISILGDGKATKDYIYIDDAIRVILSTLDRKLNQSELYNVCSGHSINLIELLNLIFLVTGKEVPIEFLDAKKSDNQNVILSNEKMNKIMGNHEFISLKEGIVRIWNTLI